MTSTEEIEVTTWSGTEVLKPKQARSNLTEEIILHKAIQHAIKLIREDLVEEAVAVLEAAVMTAEMVAKEFGRYPATPQKEETNGNQ